MDGLKGEKKDDVRREKMSTGSQREEMERMSTEEKEALPLKYMKGERGGEKVDQYRWQKAYSKKRVAEDEEFRKRRYQQIAEYKEKKWRDDVEWREEQLRKSRERYLRRKEVGAESAAATASAS